MAPVTGSGTRRPFGPYPLAASAAGRSIGAALRSHALYEHHRALPEHGCMLGPPEDVDGDFEEVGLRD